MLITRSQAELATEATSNTNAQLTKILFVILSVAKNLSYKADEILHCAALRSE
jgi:hypothetical protein